MAIGLEASRAPVDARVRRRRRRRRRAGEVMARQQQQQQEEEEEADRGGGGDIVIVSNGPGELAAWVQPLVRQLRASTRRERVSVLFAPCPHASGKEVEAAQELLVDDGETIYVEAAELLWRTVVLGQPSGRQWGSRGVVVHLGGEQLYSVLLAARKRWPCVMYVEDAVRWSRFATYAVRDASVLGGQRQWAGKVVVIGDLMQDAVERSDDGDSGRTSSGVLTVGVLFGSKGVKLGLGVPYFAATVKAVAAQLQGQRVRFVAPLAPTVSVEDVRAAGTREMNEFAGRFGCDTAVTYSDKGIGSSSCPGAVLVVDGSVQIELWPGGRAHYGALDLAITTAGTNTAELGHMGIPMILVLPTFELALFQAAGGILELLGKLPGAMGKQILGAANAAYLKTQQPLAWPNKWARRNATSASALRAPMVVPEMVGEIEPEEVAAVVCEYILDGDKLAGLKRGLLAAARQERREALGSGLSPSQRLAQLVLEALANDCSAA